MIELAIYTPQVFARGERVGSGICTRGKEWVVVFARAAKYWQNSMIRQATEQIFFKLSEPCYFVLVSW